MMNDSNKRALMIFVLLIVIFSMLLEVLVILAVDSPLLLRPIVVTTQTPWVIIVTPTPTQEFRPLESAPIDFGESAAPNVHEPPPSPVAPTQEVVVVTATALPTETSVPTPVVIVVTSIKTPTPTPTNTATSVVITATSLSELLWQIGKPTDPGEKKIQEVTEFADGLWQTKADYVIGSDPDPINNPSMPGYLDSSKENRVDTTQAREITIHFKTACSRDMVDLVYARFGDEGNKVYLDGFLLGEIPPLNNRSKDAVEYTLAGPISAGKHQLAIVYNGGGANNGHHIDYVRLTAKSPCK